MTITSKPDWGSRVSENGILASQFQDFFDDLEQQLNAKILGLQVQLQIYTVATVPPVVAGGMIFVSDETGGAVPAFSDGTNWRRVTDRAVVS